MLARQARGTISLRPCLRTTPIYVLQTKSSRLFSESKNEVNTRTNTAETPNWKLHRTGTTALLWSQRQLEQQKQRLDATGGHVVPHALVEKAPEDSFVQVRPLYNSHRCIYFCNRSNYLLEQIES